MSSVLIECTESGWSFSHPEGEAEDFHAQTDIEAIRYLHTWISLTSPEVVPNA